MKLYPKTVEYRPECRKTFELTLKSLVITKAKSYLLFTCKSFWLCAPVYLKDKHPYDLVMNVEENNSKLFCRGYSVSSNTPSKARPFEKDAVNNLA